MNEKTNTPETSVIPLEYPSLLRRYKAVLVDALILLFTFFIILSTVVYLPGGEIISKIMCAALLLTYEPILTAGGGTLGQRLVKIRARRQQDVDQHISVPMAYIRFVSKVLLGWVSFISIHFNAERRAMHDLACGSVMVCLPA